MSNWRPTSLLNTDLKIASAAIANRFKQVLGGRNGLFHSQNIMTEKQKHQYRSKRIYRNLL
jgi:hypothetical protein